MIRLLLRFGFWTVLVTAVLPGLKHADVFKDGVNAETLERAAQLSLTDLVSFCGRNPSICEAGQSAASLAIVQAKSGLLIAYHGIRQQYDAPGRETPNAGSSKE